MALNPNIILAGQTPDIIGTLARSTQAAAGQNELTRRNALEQLYRTQGAGIAAGDPNAVNALAGYDPMAAMQVQDTITQRQRTATADSRGDQEWRWRVEEYAASKTAAERAAEAAQVEESVKMGLSATSPQQWDAMMAQMGADDLIGQFDNRQAIANRYLSVAEILKGLQGPAYRKATPEEAASYGAQAGQFDDKGKFYPLNPPSGTSLTTNPDGSVTFLQGAGVAGKPLTEAQSRDNTLATRAEGALTAFEPYAEALTSYVENGLEAVPFNLGKGLQGDNFQLARQAGRELLAVILRKDTGAAVTTQEEQQYGQVFLPQPGDGAAVIEAKRLARFRAVEALKSGMSPAQILQTEEANVRAAGRAGVTNPAAGSGSQPPAASLPAPLQLSPEAERLLQKYGTPPGSGGTQ